MTDINDFPALFRNQIPLIDTRAPVEFNRGSMPSAINLPLMNDAERESIGRCYKDDGPEAAIALGHQLVTGTVMTVSRPGLSSPKRTLRAHYFVFAEECAPNYVSNG